MIDNDDIYKIVIGQADSLSLVMIYAEIGGPDYEVIGTFSSSDGDGLFHQRDGITVVDDDIACFESKFDYEPLAEAFRFIQAIRDRYELLNDEGLLVGFSELGISTLKSGVTSKDGVMEFFSVGASEDFIIDCQDQWTIRFRY